MYSDVYANRQLQIHLEAHVLYQCDGYWTSDIKENTSTFWEMDLMNSHVSYFTPAAR